MLAHDRWYFVFTISYVWSYQCPLAPLPYIILCLLLVQHFPSSLPPYPPSPRSSVKLLAVFGGTSFSYSPVFKLTGAKVIAVDYTFASSLPKSVVTAWQGAFQNLMKAQIPTLTYLSPSYITGASLGEELNAAINNVSE